MNIMYSRRALLKASSAALLPVGMATLANPALAATPAAPASSNLPSWFKYNPSLTTTWDFSVASPTGDRVRAKAIGFDGAAITKVLALYARPSSAYDIAMSEMLNIFDDKNMHLAVDIVYYDSKPELAAAAIHRAEDDGTKVIIAMGSDTVALLWDTYRNGKIPVVTACSKDPVVLGQIANYDTGSATNFAFTSLNMPIDAQVGYLMRLRPKLQNVAVLVDASNVSAMETQATPVAEYLNQRNIRALKLAVTNSEMAAKELPKLMEHAISAMKRNDPNLKNSVFWITGSTAIFDQIHIINALSDKVPVISVVPEVVRAGDDSAVLSVGVSFESNAHLAAIYVGYVLEGTKRVGDIPVGIVSPPDIAINFRVAKHIGLKIPFSFFESSATVFDYDGKPARVNGVTLTKNI